MKMEKDEGYEGGWHWRWRAIKVECGRHRRSSSIEDGRHRRESSIEDGRHRRWRAMKMEDIECGWVWNWKPRKVEASEDGRRWRWRAIKILEMKCMQRKRWRWRTLKVEYVEKGGLSRRSTPRMKDYEYGKVRELWKDESCEDGRWWSWRAKKIEGTEEGWHLWGALKIEDNEGRGPLRAMKMENT